MKRSLQGWRRWIGGRRLNKQCIVAMVGDGINDAPVSLACPRANLQLTHDIEQALSAADVGIAIGSGSKLKYSIAALGPSLTTYLPGDVAISSASFILVSSNLRSLLTLSDLSRTVFNRVKFNFVSVSVVKVRY